jgi:transposase
VLTRSILLANTNAVSALGPKKFADFLVKNGISKRRAARDLRVSAPTVLDWLAGVKAPEPPNRSAIRVYTRGAVVESDWNTERQREAAEKVADVKPYRAEHKPTGTGR